MNSRVPITLRSNQARLSSLPSRPTVNTWPWATLLAQDLCIVIQMPQKHPTQPSRKQYSRDLKELVIYQTKVLGLLTTDVAINLNMPVRVVQHVKKTWEEIGEVCRSRKYKGRPSLMKADAVSVSTLIAWIWSYWWVSMSVHDRTHWAISRHLPWWASSPAVWDAWDWRLPVHCCMYSQKTRFYLKKGMFIAFSLGIWLISLQS